MAVESIKFVFCRQVWFDVWRPNVDCIPVQFKLFNQFLAIIAIGKQILFIVSKQEIMCLYEFLQFLFILAS